MRIYAKILANRILPFLPKLISLDKVGFIPGGEARDNTIKAINIHHWLSTSSKQGFYLSLNTEKAFDRVAWDYMVAVLQAMGFPAHFLQWILALYASTTARIRVNGCLSDAFSVSNGTWQGCPLSPLIIVLSLEPLLHKLRANPNITGIDIRHKHYKLAAYADDILLFLSNPLITIPNLPQDFTLFHKLSNLKINFTKSKALNISLPPMIISQCQANFPFSWEPHALTYLGIQIPSKLTELYDRNYSPILQSIKNDLTKWSSGQFSWFGRIAILKMNVLPRILYILQTVPIKLPPTSYKI